MVLNFMNSDENIFFSLCQIISTLRSDQGCPWDRKQDLNSLQKYIREECDELIEAMNGDDPHHLCEEMGDVMFLLILTAEISSEKGDFTIKDVLCRTQAKMIRRHPHVFSGTVVKNEVVKNEEELKELWEKIKLEEKEKKIN